MGSENGPSPQINLPAPEMNPEAALPLETISTPIRPCTYRPGPALVALLQPIVDGYGSGSTAVSLGLRPSTANSDHALVTPSTRCAVG